MSCNVQVEGTRPRPHSGGLWTLFSWLRRTEDSSSTESISSVGSDRTATSFDFLPPVYYPNSQPRLFLPVNSPTDSYKKRVLERNLRRKREHGVTLHRKYGLWRDESAGYDRFSLPHYTDASESSGNNQVRCRRAASECLQRRVAYVPGKRRAPPPPILVTTSLPRNYKRKRPAPKPPLNLITENKENTHELFVTALKDVDVQSSLEDNTENNQSKEPRGKKERGFLKQIFEHKKRHSAIDISHIKLLPSISELDKQAAEIIENNKLLNRYNSETENDLNNIIKERKILSSNMMWMCTKCFRRYDMTNKVCSYCACKEREQDRPWLISVKASQTNSKGTTISTQSPNDKNKLKEMLKEMKDSLPNKASSSSETPTLRIGCTNSETATKDDEELKNVKLKNISTPTDTPDTVIRAILTTSHIKPQSATLTSHRGKLKTETPGISNIQKHIKEDHESQNRNRNVNNNGESKNSKILNSYNSNHQKPLSISSLLNPIYEPKKKDDLLIKKGNDRNVLKNIAGTNKTDNTKDTSANKETCVPNKVIENDIILQKSKDDQEIKSVSPSSKKLTLSPVVVSQIIKKSIEEKEKILRKADVQKGLSNNNIEKRRELVNQLEFSIAKGDEKAAAEAAAMLAKLRLSCSVISFSSQILAGPSTSGLLPGNNTIVAAQNMIPSTEVKIKTTQLNKNASEVNDCTTENLQRSKGPDASINDNVSIEVWIEDKLAARGPFRLNISRHSTVADLKLEAANSLRIAINLQRWIIGKTLCTDDNLPVTAIAEDAFNSPFYLCLVESENLNNEDSLKSEAINAREENAGEFYKELIKLEQQALIFTTENLECPICMEVCATGNGVVLRECLHSFCKECVCDVVRHCEEATVYCPAIGCSGVLQDREIRALLSNNEYEKWLARSLAAAESGTRNAFHCRTPDCSGWTFCETGVRMFPCPVCKKKNCIPCQIVHDGETCKEYQRKLSETKDKAAGDMDEGTQALFKSLISRGEALECPECRAIITKKWGCDWIKCSACKTEICWVTKGRRWGPGGKGDTSGGCRCGVDGKRCHPTCGYCH
ncbi:unnamed protein product [Leptosia nina]|uniref:RanBP-type and C3HC4-type zinc finger-containing protein 1 n=1 Tax=Leptosia nina TaxID=320188 RepID=A0AAV1JN92_9NEOP